MPALSSDPGWQDKLCSGNLLLLSPVQSSRAFEVLQQQHESKKPALDEAGSPGTSHREQLQPRSLQADLQPRLLPSCGGRCIQCKGLSASALTGQTWLLEAHHLKKPSTGKGSKHSCWCLSPTQRVGADPLCCRALLCHVPPTRGDTSAGRHNFGLLPHNFPLLSSTGHKATVWW